MKRSVFSILLVLIMFLTACNTITFENQADDYIKSQNINGAVLIAQKGKIIFSKAYGKVGSTQTPITLDTPFSIDAITRSFTAMGIMILQEQGKLSIEDSVCKYLATCPDTWKPITLHQLLSNTSGVYEYTEQMASDDFCQPHTETEMISSIQAFPLESKPGEKWNYSSASYYLLGVVIEKASGQDYATFIQKNIFDPLKMTASGYNISTTDTYKTLMANCKDMVTVTFASGALYSTVGDLYKWDQALYGNSLVSKATLDKLFASPVSTGLKGDDSEPIDYGFGWLITNEFGHHVVMHGGHTPGFDGYLRRYTDDDLTIIVLENQLYGSAPLSKTLADMFFKQK